MKGVAVDHGTAEDVAAVNGAFGEVSPDRIFALLSEGRRHPIAAIACQVSENDADVFDSPF